MFELEQLDHLALTVSDLDRSKECYVETLGMEHRFPGLWDGLPVMLGLGSTLIALFPAQGEDQPSATQPSRASGPLRLPGRPGQFRNRAPGVGGQGDRGLIPGP